MKKESLLSERDFFKPVLDKLSFSYQLSANSYQFFYAIAGIPCSAHSSLAGP